MRRGIIFGGGALATASVLAVVVFGTATDQRPDWWAAWGQWIGGVGAIAAAWTALWIAWHGWTRADAERRENEAAQAALLTAEWRVDARETSPTFGQWGAFADNHSPRPFYEISLEAADCPRHNMEMGWRPDEGGWGYVQVPTLAPFSTERLKVHYYVVEETESRLSKPEGRVYLTISYTDADGRRWVRTANQRVTRARVGPVYTDGEQPYSSLDAPERAREYVLGRRRPTWRGLLRRKLRRNRS